jgi:hypothetical protein
MKPLLPPPLTALAFFADLTCSGILQEQGLAKDWTLEGWEVEAGPVYFDDTVIGVKRAISEAAASAASRKATPYMLKR